MSSASSPKRLKKALLLQGAERATALQSIPLWVPVPAGERDAIQRQFVFTNFDDAFRKFMTPVATEADKRDHHPEWFNVYNRVEVTLATHECNGLSQRDIDMAQFMDKLFAELTEKPRDSGSAKNQ